MVNINRVMENVAAFVDEDLVPKMPKLEGIAFSAMAPFIIKAKVPGLLKLAHGTELVAGDNVDIDLLYREFKSKSAGKWPMEMFGFVFREDDLDKLYRYLQR
jgi:hypothetical protein